MMGGMQGTTTCIGVPSFSMYTRLANRPGKTLHVSGVFHQRTVYKTLEPANSMLSSEAI